MRLFIVSLFLFCASPLLAKYYFQQQVHYTIHVSLDDKKNELTAKATIKYVNHSLDSLRHLYFHLWPNATKNTETALWEQLFKQGHNSFIKADLKDYGGMEQFNFKVDGKVADWELLEDTIDVCIIRLKKPLAPKDSVEITTPFKVKIPTGGFSRMSHLGQAYMITQWYPKPAVYDERGWNYFPYLDQGEFYSEFGTFDVYVTLPKNYVVGATGDLVDGEKELVWLDEKAAATKAITEFPKDMDFPPSDTAMKTLHYRAENVHDFAWFADKRWHVLKGETELPQSKRKVTTWTMFTNNEAELWSKSIGYMNDAVSYFSKWVGEYPYNNVTAVDVTDAEGSGMEYPMITSIGSCGDAFELEATIAHEVGHNWFYGILGSNERRRPWMDEGMNQFFETRYIYTKYATDSVKQMEETGRYGGLGKMLGFTRFNHRTLQYLQYQFGARRNTDQQPDLDSKFFSSNNYSADAYRKTALSFDYLKSYLGDSMFDACMRSYFDRWKFKHPMPADVQEAFEKTSGKKLGWLFDDLLQSTKEIDYGISSVSKSGDGYSVSVKNRGDIASPVSLSAMKNGKVVSSSWHDGFSGAQSISLACPDCDAIKIDGEERIPEPRRRNNTIRTSGAFRKIEPVKVQWPVSIEDPDHTQLFLTPTVGWNNYNKWMLGGAVYNLTIPEKRFEYLLMPMYSIVAKELVGGGRLSYNFYLNNNTVNKINLSVGYSGYTYDHYELDSPLVSNYLNFRKLNSTLTFSLMNRKRNVDEYNYFTLRNVLAEKEVENIVPPDINEPKKYLRSFTFLEYRLGNPVTFNPYHFKFSAGLTDGLFLSSFEYFQTISFKEKGRGLEYRIFTGFNGKTQSDGADLFPFSTQLHMSGQSGPDDYLFDEVFLGRSETSGILSQQFTATQGGFKVPTYYAISELWLVSLNLKLAFPGRIPLYFFTDIGAYDIPQSNPEFQKKLPVFDYGIEVRLIPEVFSIYFPIGYSSDIKAVYDELSTTYGEKIRFELNLSKLNPFTLRDQIRF